MLQQPGCKLPVGCQKLRPGTVDDAGSRKANASYRPRGKMKACHFQIRIVLGFAVEGIDADAANGGGHHGIDLTS